MAKYSKCPNCGNKQHGDYIYRCDFCGVILCSACVSTRCPQCDTVDSNFSDYNTEIGEIVNEYDEED
jgi:hypothetical protein